MASSMSGQWLKLDGFQEYPDPITGVTKQWCSLAQGGGEVCMLNPYPASNSVQASILSGRDRRQEGLVEEREGGGGGRQPCISQNLTAAF